MSIVRQDAWTNDEDLVLAEVVLRHIREGSTQLAAFEEVGEKLSRTAAACGFRWNSSIRKKYEAAISIAKKQRKNLKKSRMNDHIPELETEVANEVMPKLQEEVQPLLTTAITFDDVIDFLQLKRNQFASKSNVSSENSELKEKIALLTEENERITKEFTTLQEKYQIMKQDYKLLMDIMDRAKQLSVNSK